jgi:nucleoside-diphosphate-sugar epimerase
MKTRVLVTGGIGFLGTEICKQLDKTHYEIITTDKRQGADIVGDLSDGQFCDSLPDVDVVINCAAVQYISKDLPFFFRKHYFLKNNIQGAKNLTSRYSGKIDYFLQIGTSMMYNQTGQLIYDTSSEMSGEGLYSKSKFAVYGFIKSMNNPYSMIIPCIIGGPGREGLFVPFVKSIMKYKTAVIPGAGKYQIHVVHVEDVAQLACLLVDKRISGIFNAAAPEPLTINQWCDVIEDTLGTKRLFTFRLPIKPLALLSKLTGYRLLAREQLLMLQMPHVLSIDEALKIGWNPKYNNKKIIETITTYVAEKF